LSTDYRNYRDEDEKEEEEEVTATKDDGEDEASGKGGKDTGGELSVTADVSNVQLQAGRGGRERGL
jgi:hypothetical protein